LNQPRWVPRNVVVDYNVAAVKVDTFGEYLGSHKNPVIVFRSIGSRVEVSYNFLTNALKRLASEEQDFAFDFVADFACEIIRGFLGLGKDDDFTVLQERSLLENGAERLPFGIPRDFLPVSADGFQRLQVVFQVDEEFRAEVFCGKPVGF